MDLFYFHNQKRVLFKTSEYEKLYIIYVMYTILYINRFILLAPAHFSCVFSSQAGLWTVFTLGGVGSKVAAASELSSPLANQSLLLLLVLANLTDAADAPNPYRQAIMSFKNTQGLWYFFTLNILF